MECGLVEIGQNIKNEGSNKTWICVCKTTNCQNSSDVREMQKGYSLPKDFLNSNVYEKSL